MAIVITLNTDGPCDPGYVLEVAEGIAEGVKVLNHLTRDHAALEYPSEADRLIRELASAAARLPQLLGQVSAWLSAEQEAGRIIVTYGDYAGQPARAVATAAIRLDEAEAYAGNLQVVLGMAASVTSTMAAREKGNAGD